MGVQALYQTNTSSDPLLQAQIIAEGNKLIRTLIGLCGGCPVWPHLNAYIAGSFLRLANGCSEGQLHYELLVEVRGEVLDALQAEFEGAAKWWMIRDRTLNAFGQKGLGRYLKFK